MAIGLNKNDYQKYGLIAAGGTFFAIFSLLFMAALIATGDVSLDDINTRKIADFLMPERELELMDDSMERPEEQEPPPDMLPPDVEMDTMEDLSGNIAPKFNFKARKQGVFADGAYVPIFQIPPQYPRRAAERGIEGCVVVEYTVTTMGTVRDPEVIAANPSGIFNSSAKRAALKYKYKPMIRDGVAVEVPGVKQRITFILEGEGKGCLLYTSPSPRDLSTSRMPSSA